MVRAGGVTTAKKKKNSHAHVCKHKSTLKCKRTHRHTHSPGSVFKWGFKNKEERKTSESRVVFMDVSRDLSRSFFGVNATNVTSLFVPPPAWHQRRFRNTKVVSNRLAQSMQLRIKKTKQKNPRMFFLSSPVFSSAFPGSRKCKKTLSSSTILSIFFVFSRWPALKLPNNEALAPEADATSVFSRNHSAPNQRQV